MFTLETVKGRYITGTLNLAQVLASGAITDSHFTTHSNILRVVVRLLSADGKQDILVPFHLPDMYNGVDPLTASVYVDATAADSFSLSRIMLSDRQHQVHTITRAELLASAPMYVPEFNITFTSTQSGGSPNINTTSGSGFTAMATPGTYGTVTVDGLGRVIAGSNSDSAAGLAADQSLASSIASEHLEHLANELSLSNAIAAESSRAMSAESSLSSALSSEVTNRTSAIASEQSRAEAAESSLNSSIAAEQTARAAAVTSLASSLAAEISRSMAAESLVSSGLASEIVRAEAAESSLASALSTEQSARISGDTSTLSSAKSYTDSAISSLVNGAPLALDTLKEIADQLASDESAAAALTSSLAGEVSRAQAAEASLAASIAAEQTARTAADSSEVSARNTAITSAVAAEAIARDSAITSAVATETAARSAADTSLASAIATESTARSAADTSLSSAISTETSRATTAETSLGSRVTTLEGKSTTGALFYDAVVGSAAQVTSGRATHTTIASALTAISAGQSILILAGTYTENVTVNKSCLIEGMGNASIINGTVAFSSATYCKFSKLRVKNNVTVSSGSNYNDLSIFWIDTGKTINDSGTSNYILAIQD